MKYYPSYQVADLIGISGHALSKITASFMVVADGRKQNIGLQLKFEAKALKVIGYSRKNGRFWEFSERAVELIKSYKASQLFLLCRVCAQKRSRMHIQKFL